MRTPEEILDEHADNHPDEVVQYAREILEEWDGWRYGRRPNIGVAAALYETYRLKYRIDKTQAEITEEFDCSSPGLRDNLNDFREIIREREIE